MDEHLDELLFPTNSDKWNTYIENGWGNNKADDSFLTNFISSATEPAPTTTQTMPAEYDSVFSDYPALNVNSIMRLTQSSEHMLTWKSKLEQMMDET